MKLDLNIADAVRFGSTAIDRIYVGASQVWPLAGGAWSPLDLGTDLIAWYDDTSIIGSVTGWTDKSGNGHHLTVSNGSPVRSSINGLSAVQYTGSEGMSGIPDMTEDWAVVGMIVGDTSKATQTFLGGKNYVPIASGNGSSNVARLNGTNVAAPMWSNNTLVTDVTRSGYRDALWLPVPHTIMFDDLIATTNINLGQGPSSYDFKGLIGEVILLKGPVATATRDQIHNYLHAKWGVVV